MAEYVMASTLTMNPMEVEFKCPQMALYCATAIGQWVHSLDHECVATDHGFN
jgi:hypothetical protein